MKVTVIGNAYNEKHIDMIKEAAKKAGAQVCFSPDENSVPQDFSDAEVVYGFAPTIAKNHQGLKWLCLPTAGVDRFIKPGTFANEDCILTNSSGAYGVTIAEHMIAVSIMMMRRLTEFHEETLRGEWGGQRSQKSLKDCRITALGTGDIGSCFAKGAKAFEPASLVGINRSGKCDEPSFDRIEPIERLDEILPETDLLAMSLPDTQETQGIMSRERLSLLPEGAYIVNVGRGSAIDEDAIADLLDEGKIAGAALDVFRTEPLPKESRLWKTKNILITPHVAGNLTLDHTTDTNVSMFCEDLLNYAQGLPLKYVVDRKKGY